MSTRVTRSMSRAAAEHPRPLTLLSTSSDKSKCADLQECDAAPVGRLTVTLESKVKKLSKKAIKVNDSIGCDSSIVPSPTKAKYEAKVYDVPKRIKSYAECVSPTSDMSVTPQKSASENTSLILKSGTVHHAPRKSYASVVASSPRGLPNGPLSDLKRNENCIVNSLPIVAPIANINSRESNLISLNAATSVILPTPTRKLDYSTKTRNNSVRKPSDNHSNLLTDRRTTTVYEMIVNDDRYYFGITGIDRWSNEFFVCIQHIAMLARKGVGLCTPKYMFEKELEDFQSPLVFQATNILGDKSVLESTMELRHPARNWRIILPVAPTSTVEDISKFARTVWSYQGQMHWYYDGKIYLSQTVTLESVRSMYGKKPWYLFYQQFVGLLENDLVASMVERDEKHREFVNSLTAEDLEREERLHCEQRLKYLKCAKEVLLDEGAQKTNKFTHLVSDYKSLLSRLEDFTS